MKWARSWRRTGIDHGTMRFRADGSRGHVYEATNQLHGGSWLATVLWRGNPIDGMDFDQRGGTLAREWCEAYERAVVSKTERPKGIRALQKARRREHRWKA